MPPTDNSGAVAGCAEGQYDSNSLSRCWQDDRAKCATPGDHPCGSIHSASGQRDHAALAAAAGAVPQARAAPRPRQAQAPGRRQQRRLPLQLRSHR
eukprot:2236362-Pyramimonas_sp.AAC.1